MKVTTRVSLNTSGLAAAALLLSACATPAPPPPPVEFLGAADATVLVRGSTEEWSKGAGYYADNGSLHALWEGAQHEGQWKVEDDGSVCVQLPVWGQEFSCHKYIDAGDKVKRKWQDNIATANIEAGNRLFAYK